MLSLTTVIRPAEADLEVRQTTAQECEKLSSEKD